VSGHTSPLEFLIDRLAAATRDAHRVSGEVPRWWRSFRVIEMTDLAVRVEQLRSLHRRGDPLVLVNVWDVASAQHVVAAGATAVATSSAAIAASLGFPDDHDAPIDDVFGAVARIASRVDVPVTADLLDGYGLEPAELVDRLLVAGAIGCNLEDSDHAHNGRLLDPGDAANRLAAVRSAASRAGVHIVINARIDAYLHDGLDATPAVLDRARRYLDAGADCVYPIRLTDPSVARQLVDKLDAAVNANLAGGTTVAQLADAGVSRISIGPTAFRSVLAALDQLASRLLGAAAADQ
jgi:2-methylisocitrate lyase-like PEP mutase family enzyme